MARSFTALVGLISIAFGIVLSYLATSYYDSGLIMVGIFFIIFGIIIYAFVIFEQYSKGKLESIKPN